jgi:hypothetical protein
MSFDFDQIVENHFKEKRDIFGFESIAQLIEEVLDQRKELIEVLTEADEKPQMSRQEISLLWDGIADLAVTELPWANPSSQEGGTELDSTARNQLEQFLSRVAGNTLPDKLRELKKLYNTEDFVKNDLQGKSRGAQISIAISYLTFYKTLTKIVAHFNAASAGFSFEAFLSVLLQGKQIPAGGAKTIADIKDEEGTPISLKLYAEDTLTVDGSYKQIVDDLVRDPYTMQYVVATKTLEGEQEEMSGQIKFYRFQFTLDNVMNILSYGARNNPLLIQLPAAYIAEGGAAAFADIKLPEPPTEKELIDLFNDGLRKYVELEQQPRTVRVGGEKLGLDEARPGLLTGVDVEKLIKGINYPANSVFFTKEGRGIAGAGKIARLRPKEGAESELGKIFWSAGINPGIAVKPEGPTHVWNAAKRVIEQTDEDVRTEYLMATAQRRKLIQAIAAKTAGGFGTEAHPEYQVKSQLRSKKKGEDPRAAVIKGGGHGFASTEKSIEFYNKLKDAGDRDGMRRALLMSRGVVYLDRFELVKTEIEGLGDPQLNALPAGQTDIHLETLEIGYAKVAEMINGMGSILDASVLGIFRDLKTLTVNIQAFFANDLKSEFGENASAAADDISQGVGEVTGPAAE